MKKVLILVPLVCLMVLLTTAVYAQYAGGTGTQADPYLIETPTHLNNVRNNLSAHFKQIANINLDVAPYNTGSGWVPIGGSGAPFTGTYDGDSYIVSNLMINRTDLNNVGLFGFCQEATLRNIGVFNINVTGGRWVGGLVGDFSSTTVNAGSITNCSVTGRVTGLDRVGGLAGFMVRSTVSNCHAAVNVTGTNNNAEIGNGGLIGFVSSNGTVTNSYATGSVSPSNNGTYNGGLIGRCQSATITNCYAIGTVTGQTFTGGLIGGESATTTTTSYWNTQTSGQNVSAGGLGRNTMQMSFPYDAQTYVNWNFDTIWGDDFNGDINDGYPFLQTQPGLGSPNPTVAANPTPGHQAEDVSVDLEEVSWTYTASPVYADPVGFRVYLNTTGQFNEQSPYIWVAYVAEQENYSTSEVLPENIMYGATYFWKVVPTTIDPNRGDAENVPVWSFTVERSDNPYIATNPSPEDEAEEVGANLANLSWSYSHVEGYERPIGFRVYFNTTGEFDEQSPFDWVNYQQQQTNYNSSLLLPPQLARNTTYYWKIVPTTIDPNRGDAVNVPIWSFTTVGMEPNPAPATNPAPPHLATGITLGLTSVSWDYEANPDYTDPVGFRVYMNTTGGFGGNAPFEWVPYVENQVEYFCEDIIPETLDPQTTYYWRVVPTTIYPNLNFRERGDAEGVVTWRFTTGTTDVQDDLETPFVTRLKGNYPNPFNPETTISFSLATTGNVSIDIFDIKGTKVVTLLNDYLNAGNHHISWNGKNQNGSSVTSGVYFYRMNYTDQINPLYTKTQRMILLK